MCLGRPCVLLYLPGGSISLFLAASCMACGLGGGGINLNQQGKKRKEKHNLNESQTNIKTFVTRHNYQIVIY